MTLAQQQTSYRGETVTEFGIHRHKSGLSDGALKQQPNGALQDVERGHKTHQLTKQAVKLFRGELVDNATNLTQRLFGTGCLGGRCPRLQALV